MEETPGCCADGCHAGGGPPQSGVIYLYRLGGTTGRAVASVSYVPPMVELEHDAQSHANAAGAGASGFSTPITLSSTTGSECKPYAAFANNGDVALRASETAQGVCLQFSCETADSTGQTGTVTLDVIAPSMVESGRTFYTVTITNGADGKVAIVCIALRDGKQV